MDTKDFQSHILDKNKKICIAYINEPPFYWTEKDGTVKGADIELIDTILRKISISSIEYHLTTFEELVPGVQAGRWDINVPIFITAERAKEVNFSVPVWALGDGFVVQHGNPKNLTSYEAVAMRIDAKLGLIPGQIQFDKAKSAGVIDSQIVMLKNQDELIAALQSGKIDAFAATAVGNNAIAKLNPELQSVPLKNKGEDEVPVGAFSFSKDNQQLKEEINAQLRKYLGSEDHRKKMA
jgi:polar amino acid transport system substrate-binding protein